MRLIEKEAGARSNLERREGGCFSHVPPLQVSAENGPWGLDSVQVGHSAGRRGRGDGCRKAQAHGSGKGVARESAARGLARAAGPPNQQTHDYSHRNDQKGEQGQQRRVAAAFAVREGNGGNGHRG